MANKTRWNKVKRSVKRFWKQNKSLIKGGGQLLLAVFLVVLITIPFLREDNPGNDFGIDVSSHNGKVAWDDVAENGVAFAVLRAGGRSYGNGDLYKDARFKHNMRAAWFHHIDRGVYFYSQAVTEEEAVEEADFVLRRVNGAALELPVFLDIEDTGTNGRGRADGLSRDERTAVALAFCARIAEKGYTPGVYANKWYLESALEAEALEAAGVQIWLAEYTQKNTPAYAGSYDYWQYSKRGTVPGIAGEVDLDRAVR